MKNEPKWLANLGKKYAKNLMGKFLASLARILLGNGAKNLTGLRFYTSASALTIRSNGKFTSGSISQGVTSEALKTQNKIIPKRK